MSTVLRQLTASNGDVGRLKLENEQMARLVEEGKDEIASLQAQLTSSDSHGDQLSQMQKDLTDKNRKIQVPYYVNLYSICNMYISGNLVRKQIYRI